MHLDSKVKTCYLHHMNLPEDIADTESRRAEFDPPLEKRTWMYAGPPISYGIPPCKCGNENCVYSEYKDRLWCDKCQIDFEPEHWGIFDGPILFEMGQLLGYNFDRIDLVNNVYVAWDGKFDADDKPIEFILRTTEEVNARLEALHKKTKDFAETHGIRAVGDKIILDNASAHLPGPL